MYACQRFVRQAQLIQGKQHRLLVENSHHHGAAECGGNNAHTQVDVTVLGLDLEPAILRQAFFGNVEVGENLDAADDRGVETANLGRHVGGMQHAVDAIANSQVFFIGFDMDIAGAVANRLQENLIDQLDDGGFLRLLDQVGIVDVEVTDHLNALVFADHLLDGTTTDAEVLLDDAGNLFACRQHRFYLRAHEHAKLVEGIKIERIVGGHTDGTVVPVDRNHAVAMNDFGWRELEQLFIEFDRREVDQGYGKLLAVDFEIVAFVHEAEADQSLLDPLVGLAGVHGRFELGRRNLLTLKQNLAETHRHQSLAKLTVSRNSPSSKRPAWTASAAHPFASYTLNRPAGLTCQRIRNLLYDNRLSTPHAVVPA